MATQKTIYRTMKDSPDAWLQAAVDAQEITEKERELIEKFIEAQTKEEAERQMDALRAAMATRPEFALSQAERDEIAATVKEISDNRMQLEADIKQLLEKQAQLDKAGKEQTVFTAEQKAELDTIAQTLQERYKALSEEVRRFNTYSMINALATSEQAQEQANKWYEEIGRDQGRNLLQAIGEYSQVAIHALIPGHKDQVQEHLQKAEIASGKYQDAIARRFDNQIKKMEPSRKERREDNKMTRQANKQIKKVQRAKQTVNALEKKLINEARSIALNEYRFRQRFNNIAGWQQGTPVDKTFQQIKGYKQAVQFMQERRPEELQRIQEQLSAAKENLQQETDKLNTVMKPMLDKLDKRQQALTNFVQDYQHAISHGYVGNQRADSIFEHLAESTKYAVFTPEFVAKLEHAGVEFNPKYKTIGAKAQEQAEPQPTEPTTKKKAPTQSQPQQTGPKTPNNDGPTGPAKKAPETQNQPQPNEPKYAPTMTAAQFLAEIENESRTKCACIFTKTGPQVLTLSADKDTRDKEIERLKAQTGGKVRILREDEAQKWGEKEGLKYRGAQGLSKEHKQEWYDKVNQAYSKTDDPQQAAFDARFRDSAPVAAEIAHMIHNNHPMREVLEYVGELAQQNGGAARVTGAMAIAFNMLECEDLQPVLQGLKEFRMEQENLLGQVVDAYPHGAQIDAFMARFEGQEIEDQNQTNGTEDHNDHDDHDGPTLPGE